MLEVKIIVSYLGAVIALYGISILSLSVLSGGQLWPALAIVIAMVGVLARMVMLIMILTSPLLPVLCIWVNVWKRSYEDKPSET